MQDPEIIVHAHRDDLADAEVLADQENCQLNGAQQQQSSNTHHKDFGKVPKYLAKYKEEAVELA